jgi:hypothetical protein
MMYYVNLNKIGKSVKLNYIFKNPSECYSTLLAAFLLFISLAMFAAPKHTSAGGCQASLQSQQTALRL